MVLVDWWFRNEFVVVLFKIVFDDGEEFITWDRNGVLDDEYEARPMPTGVVNIWGGLLLFLWRLLPLLKLCKWILLEDGVGVKLLIEFVQLLELRIVEFKDEFLNEELFELEFEVVLEPIIELGIVVRVVVFKLNKLFIVAFVKLIYRLLMSKKT